MHETWTRITTHLDGIAHEIQLISSDLPKWLDLLEGELDVEHLRGTDDGATRALTFAQQAAQLALAGDVDSFGGAWGVCVTALWMFCYPSCPVEGCQNRNRLSEMIAQDGGAHIVAACSEFTDNKWLFDLKPDSFGVMSE